MRTGVACGPDTAAGELVQVSNQDSLDLGANDGKKKENQLKFFPQILNILTYCSKFGPNMKEIL